MRKSKKEIDKTPGLYLQIKNKIQLIKQEFNTYFKRDQALSEPTVVYVDSSKKRISSKVIWAIFTFIVAIVGVICGSIP